MRIDLPRPELPPVARVTSHRPEVFGDAFRAAMQDAMRGPSGWSVGERELMAAFVSAQSRCAY